MFWGTPYIMDDRIQLRIVLIGSIVGIAILFIFQGHFSVSQQTIDRLDQLPQGKEIEVTGLVKRATDAGKVMFLEITQQKMETVTVVLFKDRNLTISEGDIVAVTGSISDYQGKQEIVGSRVEVKP